MAGMEHTTILGCGMAGLAAGYYLKRRGFPFTIYERTHRVGGNCVTFEHGDFSFDSGAHRVHDVDETVTRELKELLGDELFSTAVQSYIFCQGDLIRFPLSPGNLILRLGPSVFMRAALEVAGGSRGIRTEPKNFAEFAIKAYGPTIAKTFLLNYSEKLWGVPCSELMASIAGKRLQGIDLKSFVTGFLSARARGGHMEGPFLYPSSGIGCIAERLADFCGRERIRTGSKITSIIHDGGSITGVEMENDEGNHAERTERVISTLPLPLFVEMLRPEPPAPVLRAARGLRFRNMVLACFLLDQERVTRAATVYFPDPEFPFTRVYEPKNRSDFMAPDGRTSLVLEIPCFSDDPVFRMKDETVIETVLSHMERIGWIRKKRILDACVHRMEYAYPVLETGSEERKKIVLDYLRRFSNLRLSGRGGLFVYAWIHDMMRRGREIAETFPK